MSINPDAPQNGSIQRPMTEEELVAAGYPADFHTNRAARQKWLADELAARESLLPGNVNQGQHVKQSRDRAQYVRQQQGHSLIKHLLLGVFVLWIPAIYYTFSPNHYWHA